MFFCIYKFEKYYATKNSAILHALTLSCICEYRDLILKWDIQSALPAQRNASDSQHNMYVVLTDINIHLKKLLFVCWQYSQTSITSANCIVLYCIVFNVLNLFWKHTSWWVILLIEVPWLTYWAICVYDTTSTLISVHTYNIRLILLTLIHTSWHFSLPP
jgi:hypothetical protein